MHEIIDEVQIDPLSKTLWEQMYIISINIITLETAPVSLEMHHVHYLI